MNRISTLLIFSIIFSQSLFGQSDTIIIRIGNDSLKAVGKYVNKIEEGQWEYFHFNGGKQSKGTFLNGKPIGEWTNWLPDGRILNRINYDNKGLKQGLFIEYLYRLSETHEMYFVNDTLEGKIIWRHFDGNKIIEGYYSKGLRDGRWNWYHKNGKIESDGMFVADKFEGHWIYYFDNGKKSSEGNFENGLKEGEWIFYFEEADGIRAKGEYFNDLKTGKWMQYNFDGSIKSIDDYEKDKLKE
jgi:antitoxin component YwqK of YwqJK toxin-antitoxin module